MGGRSVQASLDELGLQRPKYWQAFLDALPIYHHMVYASAYTYRATTWFDFVVPGPEERRWLADKYPETWPLLSPVWQNISERWRAAGPGLEWFTHGTTPVSFCNLCQLVLCGGTPSHNSAVFVQHAERRYVFCGEPCRELLRPSRAFASAPRIASSAFGRQGAGESARALALLRAQRAELGSRRGGGQLDFSRPGGG